MAQIEAVSAGNMLVHVMPTNCITTDIEKPSLFMNSKQVEVIGNWKVFFTFTIKI